MAPIIALLAGIPIGFVLGIVAVKIWPAKAAAVVADYDKLAKLFTDGIAATHTKLDSLLASAEKDVRRM
jgi:hypothetical protein